MPEGRKVKAPGGGGAGPSVRWFAPISKRGSAQPTSATLRPGDYRRSFSGPRHSGSEIHGPPLSAWRRSEAGAPLVANGHP
jgi:hypothetical protein